MYGARFTCDACNGEISQMGDPNLVIVPIRGESVSLQCCHPCAAELRREMLEEAEAAKNDAPVPTPPKPRPVPIHPDEEEFGKAPPPPPFAPKQVQRDPEIQEYAKEFEAPPNRLENKVDMLITQMAALVQALTPRGK